MVKALDLERAIKGDPKDSWFSVLLFRLMLESDPMNFAKLKNAFPIHAAMIEYWIIYREMVEPDSIEFGLYINSPNVFDVLLQIGERAEELGLLEESSDG